MARLPCIDGRHQAPEQQVNNTARNEVVNQSDMVGYVEATKAARVRNISAHS